MKSCTFTQDNTYPHLHATIFTTIFLKNHLYDIRELFLSLTIPTGVSRGVLRVLEHPPQLWQTTVMYVADTQTAQPQHPSCYSNHKFRSRTAKKVATNLLTTRYIRRFWEILASHCVSVQSVMFPFPVMLMRLRGLMFKVLYHYTLIVCQVINWLLH